MLLIVVVRILVFLTVAAGTTTTPKIREFSYSQPLDHFGFGVESTKTFRQRVFLDTSFVRDVRDGVPILVYFGGEASIETWLGGGGILTVAASHFHGLVVYIEHRFYGKSVPLGSIETAMLDTEVRGCFTSEQALADFAEVIRSVKTDLKVPKSPVIVFGGSYAGMLAALFRLKYPHVAVGALASSAPILASEDLPYEHQYCTLVGKDFKDENAKCYDRISRSWAMIDEMASKPLGVVTLAETFKSCRFAAQYNGRFGRIRELCDQIVDAADNDILGGIARAMFFVNDESACTNITLMTPPVFLILDPASSLAWNWQVCTELVPHQGCGDETMFERNAFNMTRFAESCHQRYGVYPHPNSISSYYCLEDIKTVLRTSATNIIFSNGLKDPWSGASILEDMSDSVVAITTRQGSHCLDLGTVKDDDPGWLRHQRGKELDILARWIKDARRSSSGQISPGTWLALLVGYLVLILI